MLEEQIQKAAEKLRDFYGENLDGAVEVTALCQPQDIVSFSIKGHHLIDVYGIGMSSFEPYSFVEEALSIAYPGNKKYWINIHLATKEN